jgi:hypothetical protein
MKELTGGATGALRRRIALTPLSLSLSFTLGLGQGKEMARVPTGRGRTSVFHPLKVVVAIDHNRTAGTNRAEFRSRWLHKMAA